MIQRRVVVVAVLAALVTANLAIARLSAAAFAPAGGPNVWSQGELAVGEEPVAAGLFDVEAMLPGQPELRCIMLRYDGSRPRADVRFSAAALRGPLASHLDVLIETGATCADFAPASVVYDGTLAGLPRTYRDAAATWTATPGERRAWRFRVTLHDDPAAQGLEASARFVWEARWPGLRAQGALAPERRS